MAAHVAGALARSTQGERVAWAQRDAATGAVIGMTSYHDVDPARRSLGIGHTVLGRPWWRTGVNTEAKLLLLDPGVRRARARSGCSGTPTSATSAPSGRSPGSAPAGTGCSAGTGSARTAPGGTPCCIAMTADEWPAAARRLSERLLAPS